MDKCEYYNMPYEYVDGRYKVDTKTLLFVIGLNERLQKMHEEKIKQEMLNNKNFPKIFKSYVKEVYSACLAKGKNPWKNKDNVIGESFLNDYLFDKKALEENKERIIWLLSLVSDAIVYTDLMKLNNGEYWTEVRQPAGMLMALGNALNLIEFYNDNLEWNEQEKNNPGIIFSEEILKLNK